MPPLPQVSRTLAQGDPCDSSDFGNTRSKTDLQGAIEILFEDEQDPQVTSGVFHIILVSGEAKGIVGGGRQLRWRERKFQRQPSVWSDRRPFILTPLGNELNSILRYAKTEQVQTAWRYLAQRASLSDPRRTYARIEGPAPAATFRACERSR